MITSGNTEIKNIYYNGKTIKKVFSCGGYVWSGDTPTPPTPTGTKLFATYLNDPDYTANCDGYSTIGRLDISDGGTRIEVTSAVIGDCINYIGNECFSGCTILSSVIIPNTVINIGTRAFENCSSLTNITLPTSLDTIYNEAFINCSGLTSITIPSSVTDIGEYAFQGCSGLTSVVINGQPRLRQYSFAYCGNLQSITVNSVTPPAMDNSTALSYTNNCPIYVPSASLTAYQSASGWNTFYSRLQALP